MENLDLNVSAREVLHLANQFKSITKIGEALTSMENLEQTVRERTVAAEQSRAEAERAKAGAAGRTEVATAEIADINRREAEASDKPPRGRRGRIRRAAGHDFSSSVRSGSISYVRPGYQPRPLLGEERTELARKQSWGLNVGCWG